MEFTDQRLTEMEVFLMYGLQGLPNCTGIVSGHQHHVLLIRRQSRIPQRLPFVAPELLHLFRIQHELAEVRRDALIDHCRLLSDDDVPVSSEPATKWAASRRPRTPSLALRGLEMVRDRPFTDARVILPCEPTCACERRPEVALAQCHDSRRIRR